MWSLFGIYYAILQAEHITMWSLFRVAKLKKMSKFQTIG